MLLASKRQKGHNWLLPVFFYPPSFVTWLIPDLFCPLASLFGLYRTCFVRLRSLFGLDRTCFVRFHLLFGLYQAFFVRLSSLFGLYRTCFAGVPLLFGLYRTCLTTTRFVSTAKTNFGPTRFVLADLFWPRKQISAEKTNFGRENKFRICFGKTLAYSRNNSIMGILWLVKQWSFKRTL